jgi:hypothetical protein
MTIAAAALFFISALLISMPAVTGGTSILLHNTESQEAPANTADTNANSAAANTDANVPVQAPAADTEAANSAPANK